VNEQTIFTEALERTDPQERDAFLAQACLGDISRRQRIDRLLAQHRCSTDFLESSVAVMTEQARPEGPGVLIGPYKLLEQIGEGGMGTVWMAQQTEPVKRVVAMKLIKAGMDTKQLIARFEVERQALALMDHANIARVLDAGTTSAGRPYFVMDLVKGVPITRYCDEHRLTPRQRLELFLPVCQAVHHAHQKGIIHRDLKPSNVLVALYDGKPVPKIIDFGVAKAAGQSLTDKTLVTGFGNIVGTLEYMSPEQAEINQLDIDTRSDIYSLGVLLYELLTGTTPLERKRVKESGMLEALRIIREEDVPTLSNRLATTEELPAIAANRGLEPAKLTKLVRGELDWIVMKALEKDRNLRYETANTFAGDIQRYLSDEQVQAVPPSAGYRLRKFARRNKGAFAMATVIALAVLLAVVALATSTVLTGNASERERREANLHRITLAHQDLSADDLARALKLLEACPEDLREWEWHYLMRLCKVEPLVLREKTALNAVAFSPDGEHVASAGADGAVKIWNSRTGIVVQTLKAHEGSVACVAFHPDGKHVASTGSDRKVKVWDLTTEREVFSGPCDAIRKFGAAYTVAFRVSDGRQLAAGSGQAVRIWDWERDKLIHTFTGHEEHPISVAFSSDGQRLATASWREGVKLWDPTSGGGPLHTFSGYRHPISALAFSQDGGRLASACYDRTVKVWNPKSFELLYSLLHGGNVECVTFSPDGKRVVTAGEHNTVYLWDAITGREVLGLRGHTDRCMCVAFSPDGKRLASASTDGTIRFWDATPLRGDEGQETLTIPRDGVEIRSVAISPDGQKIASVGHGLGTLLQICDVQTGRDRVGVSEHQDVAFCVAWHPDGQRLASTGSDGRQQSVWVWDAQTGKSLLRLPPRVCYAVAFSPDRRYLVTGGVSGALEVWDASTGKEVGRLGPHEREIRGLVFSDNGRYLASSSGDGVVKVWDATRLDQKHEALREFRARVPGASLNVAFSPDGQRLATAGEKNTVKIWDVAEHRELRVLQGHNGEVYTLAFSPDKDGRWIASAGEDSAVKIWDSHTGELVRSYRGHTGLVSSLAFSSDGRRLISGSRDSTIKVWDVPK
jgi:WD40 repeat protein/serine/threonine protein kinase